MDDENLLRNVQRILKRVMLESTFSKKKYKLLSNNYKVIEKCALMKREMPELAKRVELRVQILQLHV
jgi:hypothetical protein